MDEKWDIDIKSKKSAPKKGRRAGLGFHFSLSPKDDEKDVPDEVDSFGGKDSAPPSAPPRTRKTGGWADETLKSGKKRSASLLEQEQLDNKSRDSDDDIPVIPNLDDYVDDELVNQIAKAPLIGVNRVATYKELETDLLKHAAFASLEEVNLRVLTKFLHPESAVQEADVPWTKESLFSEVVSGLNEEKEKDDL